MDRSRVGIVIPALNEADTITDVVKSSKNYGVPIVVDDGSTDATANLAKQSGAVVVSHFENVGYDRALNSGFFKAAEIGCEIVITVDADGQHNPLLIQRFIDTIDAQADVVIGIRSHKQRLTEHIFAMYTRLCFGIQDPLCGIKGYRISIFKALGHFDSYGSVGTELSLYAARRGYIIHQLAFPVRARQGKSRFGSIINANIKIFRAMVLGFCWR